VGFRARLEDIEKKNTASLQMCYTYFSGKQLCALSIERLKKGADNYKKEWDLLNGMQVWYEREIRMKRKHKKVK
jgi:hypothetical protein